MRHLPKEVWIPALCQVLFTAGISVDLTITSLAGQSLTTHPGLATVPFALLTVGEPWPCRYWAGTSASMEDVAHSSRGVLRV